MADYHRLLAEQANIRAALVPPLLSYLRYGLSKAFGGHRQFRLQLYGSLHHGLFIPEVSKVCIDISPDSNSVPPPRDCLHILTSVLQQQPVVVAEPTHPVLLWHRTAQRPAMLLLMWRGVLVHVTYRNRAGAWARTAASLRPPPDRRRGFGLYVAGPGKAASAMHDPAPLEVPPARCGAFGT